MVVEDHALGCKDGRMDIRVWIKIHPVQIHTPLVGSVEPPLYPIGIKKGDELEDILFAELDCSFILGSEDEVKESVEYKTGGCLSRMYTTTQEEDLQYESHKYQQRLLITQINQSNNFYLY